MGNLNCGEAGRSCGFSDEKEKEDEEQVPVPVPTQSESESRPIETEGAYEEVPREGRETYGGYDDDDDNDVAQKNSPRKRKTPHKRSGSVMIDGRAYILPSTVLKLAKEEKLDSNQDYNSQVEGVRRRLSTFLGEPMPPMYPDSTSPISNHSSPPRLSIVNSAVCHAQLDRTELLLLGYKDVCPKCGQAVIDHPKGSTKETSNTPLSSPLTAPSLEIKLEPIDEPVAAINEAEDIDEVGETWEQLSDYDDYETNEGVEGEGFEPGFEGEENVGDSLEGLTDCDRCSILKREPVNVINFEEPMCNDCWIEGGVEMRMTVYHQNGDHQHCTTKDFPKGEEKHIRAELRGRYRAEWRHAHGDHSKCIPEHMLGCTREEKKQSRQMFYHKAALREGPRGNHSMCPDEFPEFLLIHPDGYELDDREKEEWKAQWKYEHGVHARS